MAELLLALLVVSIIVSATIPTFTKKGATNEQVFKWSQNNGSGYSIAEPIIIGSNMIPGSAGGSVDDKFAITKKINDTDYAEDSFITFYDYPESGTYNNMLNRGRLFTDQYNLGIGFHVLNNLGIPDDSGTPKYQNMYNTVLGHNALANTNSANTAIGYGVMDTNNIPGFVDASGNSTTAGNADLSRMFGTRSANTAVGAFALSKTTQSGSVGRANTAVGALALHNYVGSSGAVGVTVQNYGNVAVGAKALGNLESGTNNVALGVEAASEMTKGFNNIAVGFQALNLYTGDAEPNSGGGNIAIGIQSLGRLAQGNNNIVIGGGTANGITNMTRSIIIGSSYQPAAANGKLLVGMVTTPTPATGNTTSRTLIDAEFEDGTVDASGVYTKTKNGTLTINGDLIVNGNIKVIDGGINVENTTKETANKSVFKVENFNKVSPNDAYGILTIDGGETIRGTLVVDPYVYNEGAERGARYKYPMSFEGITTTGSIAAYDTLDVGAYSTTTGPIHAGTLNIYGTLSSHSTSFTLNKNITVTDGQTIDGVDISTFKSTYDSHTHSFSDTSDNKSRYCGSGCYSDFYNHNHSVSGTTGTPSDIRLKENISDNVAGLKEINQLEVKNYTYKKDETKTPHVGVIAQSLQKVFPNAVKADEDGYLMIRWEDMFYAMINAIKELYTNFQDLTAKITGLDKRLEELEEKNKALEARLEKLEKKQVKKEKTKLSAPVGEEMEEGK